MPWDSDALASPHTARELQQDDCCCGGWSTGQHRVWCLFAPLSQRTCTDCHGLIGMPHLPSCPNEGAVSEAQTSGGRTHA